MFRPPRRVDTLFAANKLFGPNDLWSLMLGLSRESPTQLARLGDRHFAFLQPDLITDLKRLLLGEHVFEIRAHAAIIALAVAGLFWIRWMIEVHDRIPLVAEHKAHRIPWQVDRPFLGLRLPVASFAALARPVGPHVVGVFLRFLV